MRNSAALVIDMMMRAALFFVFPFRLFPFYPFPLALAAYRAENL